MGMTSVLQGRAAEYRARKYLERRSLSFIAANFRCRQGEIDLIMRDESLVVFVEVRCRKNSRYGNALESIGESKMKKIIAASDYYLSLLDPDGDNIHARFDVVAYNRGLYQPPDWIINAFEGHISCDF